jgi:hypothetical protein
MALLNTSGALGSILYYFSLNITGSEFLTQLFILFLFFIFGVGFRLPNELIAVFLLPIVLVLMAYASSFYSIGGIILIYIGILIVLFLPINTDFFFFYLTNEKNHRIILFCQLVCVYVCVFFHFSFCFISIILKLNFDVN